MKLSKQERIGILVIAVILIIGLGIWLFIVPRFQAIGASTTSLENKISELDKARAKQATKDDLKEQVMLAYEEGENLANMFFEELEPYMADHEFREFLAQCESNVLVEAVTVSEKSTYTLAPTYYTEDEVTYALKTYVTQGLQPSEDEIKAEERLALLKNTLGSAQTVGATSVTFDVSAIDPQELINFIDEINSYEKEEDGTPTRKAIMIDGFSLEYPLVEKEYSDIADEIEKDAYDEGTKELYKNFNRTRPADLIQEEKEDDEEADLAASDYLYTVTLKLNFFSVERMQDPTEQLKAQDSVIF